MHDEVRFYWWSRCSTCRDARRKLDELSISFTERDFFREPLSESELRDICDRTSVDAVFSWASPSAKDYRHRRGEMGDDELIELMLGEPRLIRRPLVVADETVVVGFKPDQYGELAP